MLNLNSSSAYKIPKSFQKGAVNWHLKFLGECGSDAISLLIHGA